LIVRFAIASDVGRVRSNNEDAACAVPELGLFAVADGMGGHVAGELASRLALDTFVEVVRRREIPRRMRDLGPLLCEAMLAANSTVNHEAEVRGLAGMGTTLTSLSVHGRTAVIAHVGDSRAYLLHHERAKVLTRDHTLANLLVEGGALPADRMGSHPERHVLLQAIGPMPTVQPDVSQTRLPPGARLLLSTDGLHDVVPDEEIAAIALADGLEEAAKGLVACANAHGGPDNVTVLLLEP
jgi:protein phosphatase